MASQAGIYGFAIGKPIDVQGARIEAVHPDPLFTNAAARDQSTFHLTATVTANALDETFLFNLEAVLAFIERLDVLIADPVVVTQEGAIEHPKTTASHRRSSGGGPVLPEDAWPYEGGRGQFIRLAMDKLADKDYCEQTTFNTFLFKYVESFRQRKPFIEVSWFFMYSGLEAFARAVTGNEARNASEPITELLKSYGFQVYQDNSTSLQRSVSTYTHLRNALFHNGRREVVINVNGSLTTLRMIDYMFHFQQLVALVLLKAVGFDDGHINWDSWMDRHPFK